MEHSFRSQSSCPVPHYPTNSMRHGHLVQSSNACTPNSNYKNSLGDSHMVPPCPLSQVATSSRQVCDFPLLHSLHSHHNLVSSRGSVPMFCLRACHVHTSIRLVKDIPGVPRWSPTPLDGNPPKRSTTKKPPPSHQNSQQHGRQCMCRGPSDHRRRHLLTERVDITDQRQFPGSEVRRQHIQHLQPFI
jgi:hypothetical protein